MGFTSRIDVDLDVPDAIEAVTAALKDQGFRVLTRIDVQATLKEKLDVDTEPQVILGACNPTLAHQALEIDPRIAALLPCNVVVRREDGRTVIEALDPNLIATIPDDDALRPVAADAAHRLRAAMAAVAQSPTRR